MLGEALVSRLRDAFLASVGVPLDHLPEVDQARTAELTQRIDRPFLTRSLDVIGTALVEMAGRGSAHHPGDRPRPPRGCHRRHLDGGTAGADRPPGAAAGGGRALASASVAAAGRRPRRGAAAGSGPGPAAGLDAAGGPGAGDRCRGRGSAQAGGTGGDPAGGPSPSRPHRTRRRWPPDDDCPPAGNGGRPRGRRGRVGLGPRRALGIGAARFATAARLVEVADGAAVVALPNEPHRQRCEEVRADLEAALSAAVGSAVPVRLVVDEGGPGGSSASPNSAAAPADDEEVDLDSLVDASGRFP